MELTAGELTDEHIGKQILDVPENGWEPYLLLQSVEHGSGVTMLMFRWNDDPNPRNTLRGKFAIGIEVPSDTILRVVDE